MEKRTQDYVLRLFEGVSVIRLTAENLTSPYDIERVTNDIDQMIEQGMRKLVIDFKLVRYVSSAALGMLIAINQRLRKLDGQLVISHPEMLEDLLKLSNTAKLFKLAPDPKLGARMIKD